jgi:hypothetical protein
MSQLVNNADVASTEVERPSDLRSAAPLARDISAPSGAPSGEAVRKALKGSVSGAGGNGVAGKTYSPEALRLFNEVTAGSQQNGIPQDDPLLKDGRGVYSTIGQSPISLGAKSFDITEDHTAPATPKVAASATIPESKKQDIEGQLHNAFDDVLSSCGALFAKLEGAKGIGDFLGVMRDMYLNILPKLEQFAFSMFSVSEDQFQAVLKKLDFSKISSLSKGIFAASADQDSPRHNGVGHYVGAYADAVGLQDLTLQAQLEKKLREQDDREPIDLFDAKAAVVASIRDKLPQDVRQQMNDAISGLGSDDSIPFHQRKDYSEVA